MGREARSLSEKRLWEKEESEVEDKEYNLDQERTDVEQSRGRVLLRLLPDSAQRMEIM